MKLWAAFLLLVASAPAQMHRHDPLTPPEVDKIRDSAMEPEVRLKLYIEFARARLDKLQQARSDPKITDKDEQTQAALQDLIDRQLIIQAFKKENYQIPDHFVEERMHDIVRTDFGGDRNTFIKTLEAQNFSMG